MTKQEIKDKIDNAINDSTKKYFTQVTDKSREIKKDTFVKVIEELFTVSTEEAKVLIQSGDVVVNGNLVKDVNFVLNEGYTVRGYLGKFLNNSPYICKII